ncbi:DUF2007 domain-containing protein [Reinekea sp. G2M2-21]|uniref:putative signal transducing protein n=1 Tax=Reinekea sp. G2M2-21 TaxID=2788942 RepID=UPI0018AA0058|nr:DUF2007 domain-containing protein [Reinekea sp. G2M2-21]
MLIYTHPLLYQVVNVQNLLSLHHIETIVRNEYAAGATGDLSANETWAELWLQDERDQAQAQQLIAQMDEQSREEWFCSQCGEKNSGSFEVCWQCQTERRL